MYSFAQLLYSCGSLYTSVVPCLAIKGVGLAIAQSRTLKWKVMLLNSKTDRETAGMTATDFVTAMQKTLNRTMEAAGDRYSVADYM